MQRYEILDQAINRMINTYLELTKGFEKKYPHHPVSGYVGKRWVPRPNILDVEWQRDEAMIAAVILDSIHSEYGINQFISYESTRAYENGRYVRPAERIWPMVRVVKQEFPYLDRRVFGVFTDLVYL